MREFDVNFRKMSNNEFEKFIELSVSDYAQDLIKSGMCNEEAGFKSSKEQFDELLPQGKYTENNFFYMISNIKNEDIGTIWYSKFNQEVAFINNILVYESFRMQGYGKQTLILIENEAKEKGINKILLHVFKFNHIAFALYKDLGYKVVEENSGGMHMVKSI